LCSPKKILVSNLFSFRGCQCSIRELSVECDLKAS
jgi:hypothetical protein